MLKHIHCNKCFRIDPVKDTCYWLTNCGHIVCQDCLDRATAARKSGSPHRRVGTDDPQADDNGADSICAVCKEPCDCIQVSENVDDLPANIQPFFRPLMNLCYETLDTWKFQEQNMTELVEHLRSKTKRQHDILVKARTELRNMKILKSENRDLKTENKRAKTENENLRSENETLKQQVQELRRRQSGGVIEGGGKNGAPVTPITPQIRRINPPVDRVQPPTSSRDPVPNGRDDQPRVAKARDPQPETRHGVGGSGEAHKRTRSLPSTAGSVIGSRGGMAPRPPPPPGRLSLVSHPPPLTSPRLMLSHQHQPNEVMRSPRRPPSVHAIHHVVQPRYQNTATTAAPPSAINPPQQGIGLAGQLLNGQAGYGYQQTPVLPFAQGLAYAAPQQTWPRVDPMAAGQEGMALPGRVVVSAAQPTGIPYPVLAGSRQAAAAGGGGGGVIQDPLIRMRNSASAARTTWQQRQQQQQQQAQLQQQQQAQLQQQQHPQHYGYPMVLRSAVPRPVVLRNLRT